MSDSLNHSLRKELDELKAFVQRLAIVNILEAASIGRGGIRVYDGGRIVIENGGLQVTGTISGTGTIDWDGPVIFNGPLTTSGDTKLGGNVTITEDLLVQALTKLVGSVELLNDLLVRTGGSITVEGAGASMKIGALGTASGFAGIDFGQAVLAGYEGVVQLATPTSGIGVGTNHAEMRVGSRRIVISADAIRILGLTRLPAGVAADDVVIAASGGALYRDS